MTVSQDILKADAGSLVELFELDLNPIGVARVYRFHAGTNALGGNVIYRGDAYLPRAMAASGFEYTGNGAIPRPTLMVSAVDGAVVGLVNAYQDLVRAKVTRKRTMLKYLDAVNFEGGVNDDANPYDCVEDQVFMIRRKANHNKVVIEFELKSALDAEGAQLPGRKVTQSCSWERYKGPECGYIPGPMFTIMGVPTTDPALDVCSRHLDTGCELRFGKFNPLPFGGFPGVGLFR